jgi:hypothetical protein
MSSSVRRRQTFEAAAYEHLPAAIAACDKHGTLHDAGSAPPDTCLDEVAAHAVLDDILAHRAQAAQAPVADLLLRLTRPILPFGANFRPVLATRKMVDRIVLVDRPRGSSSPSGRDKAHGRATTHWSSNEPCSRD